MNGAGAEVIPPVPFVSQTRDSMKPVPADVYEAARRIYLGTSASRVVDDALVLLWAMSRWAAFDVTNDPPKLAFWILSQAAQDGREPCP
jgi:hypothetical protein